MRKGRNEGKKQGRRRIPGSLNKGNYTRVSQLHVVYSSLTDHLTWSHLKEQVDRQADTQTNTHRQVGTQMDRRKMQKGTDIEYETKAEI